MGSRETKTDQNSRKWSKFVLWQKDIKGTSKAMREANNQDKSWSPSLRSLEKMGIQIR